MHDACLCIQASSCMQHSHYAQSPSLHSSIKLLATFTMCTKPIFAFKHQVACNIHNVHKAHLCIQASSCLQHSRYVQSPTSHSSARVGRCSGTFTQRSLDRQASTFVRKHTKQVYCTPCVYMDTGSRKYVQECNRRLPKHAEPCHSSLCKRICSWYSSPLSCIHAKCVFCGMHSAHAVRHE